MPSTFPLDLAVVATSGSLVPGEENRVVEISAAGEGRFAVVLPDEPGPPLVDTTFAVSQGQLEALWAAVQQADFFSLDARYTRTGVDDGGFAILTVTAQGRSHQAEVENVSVPRFEDLLRAINRITPPRLDLHLPVSDPGR